MRRYRGRGSIRATTWVDTGPERHEVWTRARLYLCGAEFRHEHDGRP